MNVATFFALFWGWLAVIFTTIMFLRPHVLMELKRMVVENRWLRWRSGC